MKLISIKVVINDIIRNLGLNKNGEDIAIDDYIEWIAFHLPLIGAYNQFQNKIATIDVEDYRGKLPCDFYKMISLDKGYYHDSYNAMLIHPSCDSGCNETPITQYPYENIGYSINFDTITTAYRTGTITIRYQAFPIDEEGFPLVPDDESFRECLFWTVAYRLAIQGYPFKAPQMRNIDFCRQKQNFYTNQARANMNMPNDAQTLKLGQRFLSWGLNNSR